jgi:hypothetical protein
MERDRREALKEPARELPDVKKKEEANLLCHHHQPTLDAVTRKHAFQNMSCRTVDWQDLRELWGPPIKTVMPQVSYVPLFSFMYGLLPREHMMFETLGGLRYGGTCMTWR